MKIDLPKLSISLKIQKLCNTAEIVNIIKVTVSNEKQFKLEDFPKLHYVYCCHKNMLTNTIQHTTEKKCILFFL